MINKSNELTQMCKNFKLLREESGLSIKELSKASGVSEYMITNFENGIITKGANIEYIFKLCNFFKIKAHRIFSPISNAGGETPPLQISLTTKYVGGDVLGLLYLHALTQQCGL